MLRYLLALVMATAIAAHAQAQCNPRPQLDQSNLNLGQLLSAGGGCQDGSCNAPTAARAEAKVAQSGAVSDIAQLQQQIAALKHQLSALGTPTQAHAYKPLRVGTSAYARAEAGESYYEPTPTPVVTTPSPVQPLMVPVALALPENASAVAEARVSGGGGGCNGNCSGRGGFFRRANRTRTRATTVQNGQRTTSVAASSSR